MIVSFVFECVLLFKQVPLLLVRAMASARRLYDLLATEAGLSTETVKTILEHSKTNVVRELRAKRYSILPTLCTFRHSIVSGRSGREKNIRGYTFKSKPFPETRKVSCTVLKSLERASVSVASSDQKRVKKNTYRTKAQHTFYSNIVKSIGDNVIKEDTIDNLTAALRAIIVQCLRQSRNFVLPGLVTFERKDVEAKPAQYSNLTGYRSKVIKAKGPQRRVYGRVHAVLDKCFARI